MHLGLLPGGHLRERETSVTNRPADSISARVASHAALAPDWLAVVDGTASLTYAELERQSNQLAAHLQEAGATPERCVGLFLERSAEFVVAALAVLKTGAAYLPLDSSTPADRAAFILADAGAPLLLTHRGKTRDWPAGLLARHRDRRPGRGAHRDTAHHARPRRDRLPKVWRTSSTPPARPAGPRASRSPMRTCSISSTGIRRRSASRRPTAPARSPAWDSTRRRGRSGLT